MISLLGWSFIPFVHIALLIVLYCSAWVGCPLFSETYLKPHISLMYALLLLNYTLVQLCVKNTKYDFYLFMHVFYFPATFQKKKSHDYLSKTGKQKSKQQQKNIWHNSTPLHGKKRKQFNKLLFHEGISSTW